MKDRSHMAIYEIASTLTQAEITEALTYFAELIEATETVANRHDCPLPRCHPHAKACAVKLGIA